MKSLPQVTSVDSLIDREDWPLGRSATYEAIRRGDIPSVRIGRKILIPVAALEEIMRGERPLEPSSAL